MEEKGLVTSATADAGRRLYRPTALGERALMAARLFSGELRIANKS
jgi:DNA-binding PadR family transcriptional regulator